MMNGIKLKNNKILKQYELEDLSYCTMRYQYIRSRNIDINEIKRLLKTGIVPEYPSKNNYVKIGDKIFNGFTKKQIQTLQFESYQELMLGK